MKNRTRLSALALSGALSLSLLTACSSKDSDPTPSPEDTAPAITEPVEESETPETGLPVETLTPDTEDTPAPENTPVADPVVSQIPSEKPVTTPAPTATPEPSQEVSEGSKVQAAWDAITAQIELPALEGLNDDFLSELYGIDPADLVDYVAQIPMMNVTATEFFLAQVKDGKMDTVKAALQSRQATLEAEWQQYLPEQLELVKNYRLVTQGNYVMFCVSYEADAAVSIFNSTTK